MLVDSPQAIKRRRRDQLQRQCNPRHQRADSSTSAGNHTQKCRSNNYDPIDLKEWPTGTLLRLQAVIQWAKEIHKQFTQHTTGWEATEQVGQRHACGNTYYNAVKSESQAGKCSSSGDLGHPLQFGILDLLDLESLNKCQEAGYAFPQEVFDTTGYPVVCWRFGTPIVLRTINEKNTISNSKQLMGFQCQCHKVSDKYKDHSGHVVTPDLSIIPNEDLKQDFKRGPKYTPYANAFGREDSQSSPCKDTGDAKELLKWSLGTNIAASSEMNEIDPKRYKLW